MASSQSEILRVTSAAELAAWFERNHDTAPEMWLVFPHKASGRPGVAYDDAVEVALCYGWIDSVVHKHDAESSRQRFSPRRPGSRYSQLNIERLRKLAREGRLKPEVHEAVAGELAREFVFPADILGQIRANETAWANFQAFPPAYQRIRVAWIDAARKRPEEFRKRLDHLIAMSEQNRMVGRGGTQAYY